MRSFFYKKMLIYNKAVVANWHKKCVISDYLGKNEQNNCYTAIKLSKVREK